MRKRILEMHEMDRPREKLLSKGAAALSDIELLAILLGSGNRSHDVFILAGRILKVLDHNVPNVDPKELQRIAGVGPAKATIVAAAIELSRRRIHPHDFVIAWPTEVLPFIRYMAEHKQEHLLSVSLNGANEVLAIRTVSVGLVDRVHVHPREVYAEPITDRATSVIVAHNHPAGNVVPSEHDRTVTQRLKAAGEVLGIQLLDHIIFSLKSHYSFLENGEL